MNDIPKRIVSNAHTVHTKILGRGTSYTVECIAQAIHEAVLAERQRCAWQPIETAPRDGTPVDLWMKGGYRVVYFSMDEHGRWVREEGYPVVTRVLTEEPTHWMPSPRPPRGHVKEPEQ